MNSARPAPKDRAARDVAVESGGPVLVQAPAGSGKTTLLAQRYLRLLSTVDAPERILALTFTRRAAQEMRERVVQALKAAHLAECPANVSRQTWMLAVAAKQHLDSLQLDIERHPSRLRIETIDALNAWLAGQLPITAGAGSRLQLIEKAAPLYEEAARRALSYQENDAVGTAVEQVLALDDQRWRDLMELISQMLPSRDRWLPQLAGGLQISRSLDDEQLRRVRQLFDEDLALLVSRALSRAYDCIGKERSGELSRLMRGAAARMQQPSMLSEWQAGGGELDAKAAHIGRWRALAAVLLTGKGTLRRNLTKNEGFPEKSADKARMLDLIAELERDPNVLPALLEVRHLPDAAYSDAQWERARQMAQVLVLAAAQLAPVFREQGAVDFAAVSMAALRALGSEDAPTDLTLRLDYRLQHILVDEFQDTSSAQLKLLRLLTAGWQAGDGRSMFCVGDPMQSIYGFRDAEVRAFLELAEEGIGEVRFEVARLSSNFRSANTLVAWVNRCFSRILPRTDDRERGAIAFRPSESEAGSALDADARVEVLGFASRAGEAAAIAESIGAQIALHPQWHIAILVRAKAHARDIAHALRGRGIAFRAVDIELLQDRAVVRDLVMLIRALLHLGDRTAWLAVLRAPWAGIALADLLTIARAAPVVWEALADESVLARLSADGRARALGLRGVFRASLRLAGSILDGALGRAHLAESRRPELRTGRARTRACAGGPGAPAGIGAGGPSRSGGAGPRLLRSVRGSWLAEHGGNHDHSSRQGPGIRHGGAACSESIHAAAPQSRAGDPSIRAHRARRHGDGRASRSRRGPGPAIRFPESSGSRGGRSGSAAPAVRRLHPREIAPDADCGRRAPQATRG